jgi:hypothetical protein
MKRSIRLKEHNLNYSRIVKPSDIQLEQSPSLSSRGYVINTDENGFIKSGNLFEVSNRRTIVLGDSFVESSFLDERDRFTSIIERYDREHGSDKLGSVLNGGVSGSTSLNLLNCLINKIVPLKPSNIIFVLPSNDSSVHRMSTTYWNDSEYYSNIIPGNASDIVGGFYGNLHKPDLTRITETIFEVCRIFKIKLFFATCTCAGSYEGDFFVSKYKNKKWFDAHMDARKLLNEKLRTLCLIKRIPLIDLEINIAGDNSFFYDDLHLNSEGALKVADLIFDQISAPNGLDDLF